MITITISNATYEQKLEPSTSHSPHRIQIQAAPKQLLVIEKSHDDNEVIYGSFSLPGSVELLSAV